MFGRVAVVWVLRWMDVGRVTVGFATGMLVKTYGNVNENPQRRS